MSPVLKKIQSFDELSKASDSFFLDRLNFNSLMFAAVLNIIHWLILYIKIKPDQTNILLHYNVVYGSDVVAKSLYIYWIPLLALILFVINFIFAKVYFKKEKLIAYFINISQIVVQLIFLVASLVLIVANS